MRALDVADEVQAGAAVAAEALMDLLELRRALGGLLAVGEQRNAWGLDAQHRLGEGGAHVGELTRCSGRQMTLAPTSSSSIGCRHPGAGPEAPAPGGRCRGRA